MTLINIKRKMGSIKNIFLGLLVFLFFLGLILFIDEIHMVFPFLIDLGIKGGFLGDWSAFHIEGFHHWYFGVLLMLGCGLGLYGLIKADDKKMSLKRFKDWWNKSNTEYSKSYEYTNRGMLFGFTWLSIFFSSMFIVALNPDFQDSIFPFVIFVFLAFFTVTYFLFIMPKYTMRGKDQTIAIRAGCILMFISISNYPEIQRKLIKGLHEGYIKNEYPTIGTNISLQRNITCINLDEKGDCRIIGNQCGFAEKRNWWL